MGAISNSNGLNSTRLSFVDVDADYTLALSDENKIVRVENPGVEGEEEIPKERVITVPAFADVPFPVGAKVGIMVHGGSVGGHVLVEAADGVTLLTDEDVSELGFKGVEQGGYIFLISMGVNEWIRQDFFEFGVHD